MIQYQITKTQLKEVIYINAYKDLLLDIEAEIHWCLHDKGMTNEQTVNYIKIRFNDSDAQYAAELLEREDY